MITIPTGELTGLIADTAPFAFPEDDLPDVNVIRLEWDGDMLHATATDTMRSARSTWHPDDSDGGEQDSMFAVFGGADDRWVIYISLDDAKEAAKVFKLPTKENRAPLTLTYDHGRLVIARNRDTGHTAHTMVLEGKVVNFPNLTRDLDDSVTATEVGQVHYTGTHLAAFGVVRQRGPLQMLFAGPGRPTRVRIGSRFVGAIWPQPLGGGRDVVREPQLAEAVA